MLQNVCASCDKISCACKNNNLFEQLVDDYESLSILGELSSMKESYRAEDCFEKMKSISKSKCKHRKHKKHKSSLNNIPTSCPTITENNDNHNSLSFELPEKGFNFGHLNIQGICGRDMTKFDELKCLLRDQANRNLHILGISETKLKDNKMTNAFKIDGFQKPFRKDNHLNGGGGLMVYVRNGINVKRREDLEINDISCIWLEVMQEKGKPFLIGNIYRPPDSRIEFNDRFEDFIDNVFKENKEIILIGDFNKNLMADNVDREWLNFTLTLGLTQFVSNPTRVTPNTSTLIDHIYSNIEGNITKVNVFKSAISDHYAIFANRKINAPVNKHSHKTITYRSFKHFNEHTFLHELNQVPWEVIENFDDVNEMLSVWNTMFLEVVNKHMPIKQHRVKKNRQPDWLTPDIIDTMNERNRCKINGLVEQYKQLRNKVSSMIKTAKNEMYKIKLDEGKDDPRSIWKLFRELGAGGKSGPRENILGVNSNDQFITSDSEIANIFNNFFANVATQLKEPCIDSDFQYVKDYVDSKVPGDISFSIPNISQSFVRKYLSNLDISKATGLDCIGPRLLKMSQNIICSSITVIINKSLNQGIFPTEWKNAKVNPIYKSGPKDEVNNYRPISVLPTLSKIIEKWIHIKFMIYLDNYKLLHQKQSGFRAGHSTESALILMLDSWLKALNEGKFVGAVMVDFRKAFDLVDHDILLRKLKLYKCDDNSYSWFQSYLSGRTQQVTVLNSVSGPENVNCGVPQGSILGPLFFLLFINDLPLTLKTTVTSVDLYADDTTLYDVQSDKQILEENLQKSLNLIHKWCKENGLLLNTEKTKIMLITSRQKRSHLNDDTLGLTYNNLDLKLTHSEKILGVNIDDNLVWNLHFQQVVKKVSSYLWLLSQISQFLSTEDRLLFYNAYIRPQFDYCCVIWGNSTSYNINKINKLQRRACKLILRNDYTNLEEARNHLKMFSFSESVFLQKAKVMYKVANNIAPEYLIDLFQMRAVNSDDTLSNLRSVTNRNFLIPKPKIGLFKNSLSYSGAVVWNSIPIQIKNQSSLKSFSTECISWMKS